jgi:hypothetical protein
MSQGIVVMPLEMEIMVWDLNILDMMFTDREEKREIYKRGL